MGDHAAALAPLPPVLADLCTARAGITPASPCVHQAWWNRRTTLGARDPPYATSLNNLAGLYRAMGDDAAALPLFRQAMEILRTRWARATRTTPPA